MPSKPLGLDREVARSTTKIGGVVMPDSSFDLINRDPHSFHLSGQPVIKHVDWKARVNFAARRLECVAALTFNRSRTAGTVDVDLDCIGLSIAGVTDDQAVVLPYTMHEAKPILGNRLTITLPSRVSTIRIHYTTSPEAIGLQWVAYKQTNGGRSPMLFSQGQCIRTRSFLPCQDTPGVRFTFTAELAVPRHLRGLMAANHHIGIAFNGDVAIEHWKMNRPIPSYLFAFAVGDFASRDLSLQSRVWAEPDMVDAAAREFSDVPRMVKEAERLFGPYRWGRFDLLVLPRSFPYGGMENPCLVFLTPTIITGDRSMVAVVAHELAHAWTGNLVMNATWRDLWLNEGWTCYAEWRILQAVYGSDNRLLKIATMVHEFQRDSDRLSKEHPLLTALAPDVTKIDPDSIYSLVPYFKGAMLLIALEKRVGRRRFDRMMHRYIRRYSFRSIATAEFLDFLSQEFGRGVLESISVWRWVYEAGMPPGAPAVRSSSTDAVGRYAAKSEAPPLDAATDWHPLQWTLYFLTLPRPASSALVARLNKRFRLSEHLNNDVLWSFLLLATESGYAPANASVEKFLGNVGRLRYILPIYRALNATPAGKARALAVFKRFRNRYHPIAVEHIERILGSV